MGHCGNSAAGRESDTLISLRFPTGRPDMWRPVLTFVLLGGANGRPGWLGVADARPFNTQEYLRTGVAILTCSILDERLGLGLPPSLEIAYFHGPVWDEIGEATAPLMEFRDYYGHGRLFINNPLSRDVFERDMQGRIAACRRWRTRRSTEPGCDRRPSLSRSR